ncbi:MULTISPECIES: GNAT family N-acetyltransferase [unclassified Janthinobacterium]|uniref:GNAT family N-acetyltransferase n=1 Tax=unclassified Janthinobacterium TaxID=2610881 RepID=UPI000882A659|nr:MULTISPECIES: GNAT family N-acetyltransferase [unclassified Janthinobacterium]SDA64584.1 hypothetical protein SAMN03159349_02905 [Janthinobacterium sp. 551a]SFB14850.1 hypothetical protein SAMN03159300_102318 [Janthinobacterium sp. 344]
METVKVEFTGNVSLNIHPEIGDDIFLDEKNITSRLWELAGAFDGSDLTVTFEITETVWGAVPAFVLTVNHKVLLEKPMIRKILLVSEDSNVEGSAHLSIMENVEFYLRKDYRGQGIGRECFAVEVAAAHDLGFAKILANAASRPKDGWIVWPKLGYDAVIEQDIYEKIMSRSDAPTSLPPLGVARISDLWEQNLFALWDEHGTGCIMEFDCSSRQSWSMRRLLESKKGIGE